MSESFHCRFIIFSGEGNFIQFLLNFNTILTLGMKFIYTTFSSCCRFNSQLLRNQFVNFANFANIIFKESKHFVFLILLFGAQNSDVKKKQAYNTQGMYDLKIKIQGFLATYTMHINIMVKI